MSLALTHFLAATHPMLTMVLKRGYEVPEVAYPFGRPGMRFDLGDPVPWCLGIALARISNQPDVLFDEMLDFVEGRPTQSLANHYREIFDWLNEKLGRRWWIERSGGSIEFLAELRDLFPEARIVHIHRDGRETALSMREYPVLRLAVSVMYGLVGEIEYSYEGLTELEKSDGAAIDRLLETRPPIELYGRYWSEQIERGTDALRSLPADRILDLRFEDLVADPTRELERLADFLEIGREDHWIERAAALVPGTPPLRFPDLSEEERTRLEATCAPGMKLLGQAT